jgi:recombination protein RecT
MSEQTSAVAPQQQQQSKALTSKDFFQRDDVKAKFQELLGKRAPGFIASVLQTVAQNKLLAKADPASIYQAAAVAAILDLPINNNLGMAYIVPYNEKRTDEQGREYPVQVAQFQMGYKGFIQLAIRSSNFKKINATDVREGEIKNYDRLSGDVQFEWIQDTKEREAKPVVAYAAYIETNSGFSKTLMMHKDEVEKHGKRYSKTFKFGVWNTDFDKMAKKTVLKLLLSSYATLSVELREAIKYDQAVVKDAETGEVDYSDADEFHEYEEVIEYDSLMAMFTDKRDTLTKEEDASISRILLNKETASYKKVFEILSKK